MRYMFVYGSLLSSARGPLGATERRRLRWCARLVGRDTIPGRLHDLGGYPGFVPGGRVCERVHGEVWRITAPRALLAALDAYEGLDGSPPEYARERIWVDRGQRGRLQAWVYRPLADIAALPRVRGGRWRG